MEYAPIAYAAGKKMIDLGPDFRFRDASLYEQWYKIPHSCPQLLAGAVYGLPEIHRHEIADAKIIGNPGCYPTSIILALAPLFEAGAVADSFVIADSKSGISGAGRRADPAYSFVNLQVKCGRMGFCSTGMCPRSNRNCRFWPVPRSKPCSRLILSP